MRLSKINVTAKPAKTALHQLIPFTHVSISLGKQRVTEVEGERQQGSSGGTADQAGVWSRRTRFGSLLCVLAVPPGMCDLATRFYLVTYISPHLKNFPQGLLRVSKKINARTHTRAKDQV